MLVVVLLFIPVVLAYQIWAYNMFRTKLAEEGLAFGRRVLIRIFQSAGCLVCELIDESIDVINSRYFLILLFFESEI